jgi:aminobenzoyl-glutamate utilization protein B
MQEIPLPVPTEEDVTFGRALQATMDLSAEELAAPVYADKVLPPAPPKPHGGSTDTSDVSWNCPTVQLHIGNWCIGTPGHSWQAVAQGKSHYAHASMLYAGKAVAGTIIRLMEEPRRIQQAQEEHRAQTAGGYISPIPPDLKPVIPPRK